MGSRQIVESQSTEATPPPPPKPIRPVADSTQLAIDRDEVVATTESPRDKIIEAASKNGELAIIMMITRANLNECSYSFHAGNQHDFRQASSKMLSFPTPKHWGTGGIHLNSTFLKTQHKVTNVKLHICELMLSLQKC